MLIALGGTSCREPFNVVGGGGGVKRDGGRHGRIVRRCTS